MAINPTFANTPTLKKVDVNGSLYWLKDSDLRGLVSSFGTAVYKDVVTTFDATGVDIATEKATADYIAEQIAALEGAMHFIGVVPRVEGKTDAECIAAFYTTKSKTPASGDVVIMADNGKEYIYDGSKWEEVGDQNIYLTIAAAAATYVPKTRTIAGIDLADDITVEELSAASALDLKALAHKASASGTVEVLDTIDDLTVAKADTYTVTGSTVDVPATYNSLDATTSGSVDVQRDTAAAATYEKATAVSISSSAPTEGEQGNYTPAGSVTLPTITAAVEMNTTSVATVSDEGTSYSITDGSVTKADDTTAKFVKKGVSFEVGADECLNLAYVLNSDTTFYDNAVTAAGGVTYVAPVLSGALPTFGSQTVATTVKSATAVNDGNATFSGTATKLATSIDYTTSDASVTQPVFSATFTPDTTTVTPTVATTTSAQAPSGTVTIGTETKSVGVNKKTVTVTVE